MAERMDAGRAGPARAVLNPTEPDRLLRFAYDRGSNYEAEIRVSDALAALIPDQDLLNPDHRFFQVVHLVSEYSWCAMHHELRRVCQALEDDDFSLASRLVDRAVGMGEMPVACIRLLQDHLAQASFLEMRARLLDNATGLDSPGGRNLRRACLAVWRNFEAALERYGVDHEDVIAEAGRVGGPPPTAALAGLATLQGRLHALDCVTMEWNQLHLRLVRSHLGGHPAARAGEGTADGPMAGTGRGPDAVSLRGASTSDLERLADHALFPKLWSAVDDTYRSMPRPAVPNGRPS